MCERERERKREIGQFCPPLISKKTDSKPCEKISQAAKILMSRSLLSENPIIIIH